MKTGIDTRVLKLVAVGLSLVFALLACENPTGSSSENGTTGGSNGGGDAGETTFQIGDTGPAGGIVIYDKGSYSDGWRYLEAWTADETGTYQWKTSNTWTRGTDTPFGSGYENTYTAMAGSEHPAAEVVRNATHGGHDDWFLPSQQTLNRMYAQREVIGGLAQDVDHRVYWSSSEGNNEGSARARNLFNGSFWTYLMHVELKVRAVRRF